MTESSLKLQMSEPDEFVPIDVPEDASKLDMVKAAGVVGMGELDSRQELSLNINLAETPMGEINPEINPELPKDFSIDCGYILINAAECEPDWSTIHSRLRHRQISNPRYQILHGNHTC